MGLIVLRSVFILIASGIGVYILTVNSATGSDGIGEQYTLWTFYGVLLTATALVIFDMLLPKKRVGWISSIYFGILIGLFLTLISGYALTPLFAIYNDQQWQSNVMLVVGMSLCYVCTSFLFQTKDDFRFIIPYVEFRRSIKGVRSLVLDTSTLVDGRIAELIDTHIIDNPIIIPKFVVEELQMVANSSDRTRRTRGRRGLDILAKLQTSKNVEASIDSTELHEFKGQTDDLKVITLAKYYEGKIITSNYNLIKIATIHAIECVNLNEIATVMRPIYLPGEHVNITVSKLGELPSQGIGYLEDGTMVVIENGAKYLQQRIVITVTSTLQTNAGRMVFAQADFLTKYERPKTDDEPSNIEEERTV
jgi:uncharacterized protein YacL